MADAGAGRIRERRGALTLRHAPLGPVVDRNGASFSLFSEHAEKVELCIFDHSDREQRIAMTRDGDEWSASVPGVGFGAHYGFRVHGPWAPEDGHRFNANKLLIDPYARSFSGKVDYRGPVFGFAPGSKGVGEVADERDDAAFVPKSVLVDPAFDWRGEKSPKIPWRDSVIYELHVKGFTKRHPGVANAERGTYLGLASDAAIAHLQALGVTAVELLPVHECLDEPSVSKRGMRNYWGYATLGFFAPDQRFAARPGAQVAEFKEMVRRLHAAGIEVILDVVFNHTCEGDELGPSVSFRGLDNLAYYKLKNENRRKYTDFTGCGNTLDVSHPYGVRLVCDALRYWVEEMHVDGFRFDLAPALGRERGSFDPRAPLFHAMFQDPVIARAKLIAEPWDVAPDGMQLGNFPAPWREWNASFRDDIRRFWNGGMRNVGKLATRLAGSSDLFDGRGPLASINFVTAHDGFTLRDLVSYAHKHNQANGENGRDGSDSNDSTNFGIEGDAPPGESGERVKSARLRQIRNFLATLLLAPGVPMITAGDEMLRTQHGNNNPYVLDDETSWLDWELGEDASALLAFARALVSLRKNAVFVRRGDFFQGGPSGAEKDVTWFRPDGEELTGDDWSAGTTSLGAWFSSAEEDAIILSNATTLDLSFALPPLLVARVQQIDVLVDTRGAQIPFDENPRRSDALYPLAARTFAFLRCRK